jgi:hypothetical protein
MGIIIGVELFGELGNEVLEENGEDKWSEKVTNEQVLKHTGEKWWLPHGSRGHGFNSQHFHNF